MRSRRSSHPMHRRPAPWGAAAAGLVLGGTLALLTQAPAAWLAQGLAQATQGRLLLTQTEGRVWRGGGQLVLTGGPGSRDGMVLPGRLHWTLAPAGLGLALHLRTDCCHPAEATRLRLHFEGGGWHLSVDNGHSRWPAPLLSGLGTPWNTLQPEGELALRTHDLRLQWHQGRLTMSGQLTLQAQHMASRLSTLKPMGSYQLQLQGGDVPGLSLQTLEGALQLSGQGRWVGGRLRFDGEATASPGHEAALSNLLNIIGRRQGARSLISVG